MSQTIRTNKQEPRTHVEMKIKWFEIGLHSADADYIQTKKKNIKIPVNNWGIFPNKNIQQKNISLGWKIMHHSQILFQILIVSGSCNLHDRSDSERKKASNLEQWAHRNLLRFSWIFKFFPIRIISRPSQLLSQCFCST